MKSRGKRKLKSEFKFLLVIIGVLLIITTFNMINNIINGNIDILNSNKKVILIDIGHGGKDQGTKSTNGKVLEKDIVLKIGNKIIEQLKKEKDIKVIATRTTDEFLSLKDRNKLEVENNADLFISIHANAASNATNVDGIETFYWSQDNDDSYNLANIIHNNLIDNTDANDRGVKRGNYQVLRDANCPSILIETGFLTNYLESINLSNDNYQEKIATSIVKGIKEYLQLEDENKE